MTSLSAATALRPEARLLGGARIWYAAIVGLCCVLLAPLLVVDVPPLLDYPNHLARIFVLASLPDDTVLGRFYQPHWTITPNLALDLIGPPLMRILPVHVAGRLLIAAAMLLPVLGTIAYNVALGDDRLVVTRLANPDFARRGVTPRWWSLAVGLIAYNSCLLYGFLNFSISLGLALLLAATWLRWREARPSRALAFAMIGALALFACHLMGLVFFGLLIGGAELFRIWHERTVAMTLRRGAALAAVFAAPGGLYLASALQGLGGDADFMPVGEKLMQLLTTFVNYSWPLDMATAAVAIAVPVMAVILRWGRVPGPAAFAIGLLAVVFLAAPYTWKGTYYLDTRFATMLGFMLFAGFVPTRPPFGVRAVVVAALVVLFVARMGLLTVAWAAHAADLDDLRAVLEPVRPGQAVYVAESAKTEAPAYWAANPRWRLLSNGARTDEHLGGLVVIEHRAYWPFMFDVPSQQPIQTRQPYHDLAAHVGGLPDRTQAAAASMDGFDYVLLLGADAVPPLPAERFRVLRRSGYAALYAPRR